MSCLTKENIINNGGLINENSDGSVSVFVNNNGTLIPNPLNKICCETLKNTYFFDIDKQICKWGTGTTISNLIEPVKITINPNGNDGALFLIDNDETCALNISFDYLFNVSCENLGDVLNDTTVNSAQIELISNIKLYTGLIENNKLDCEVLENQISILNQQIASTNYSIFCDKIPISVISQNVVPLNQNNSFSNSAFGNTSIPQQTVVVPNTQYESANYCLTEPVGLNEWSKILGTRYQAFLDGEVNSYTCTDVIALKAVQDLNGGVIFECSTPFGVKSKMVKDLNALLIEKTNCENSIILLENQLTNFNNQLELVGDTVITAPIDFFETLDVSVTLEIVNDLNQTETVFTDNFFPAIGHGNLYSYLTTNTSSGFYVCGTPDPNSIGLSGCTPFLLPTTLSTPEDVNPCEVIIKEPRNNASSCDLINKSITSDLFIESGLDSNSIGKETFNNTLANDSLVSKWVNYSIDITDTAILELIRDKKVKLTININQIGNDFCVLLDNIVLDRNCERVISNSIFVTESPGFNLMKIVDDKKTWSDSSNHREFLIATNKNTNIIRETNYDVNDERLIVNTKEINLDINIASAIENDVWRYVIDNACLLSATCESTTITGTTTATTYHKQFEDDDMFEFEDDDTYCFEDDLDCTGTTHIIITSETINTCCDPCLPNCGKQFEDDDCFSFQDLDFYQFMDDNTIIGKGLCCGDSIDFSRIVTTPISGITTLHDFKTFIATELIDAKSRQTILGYATLRAIYDRYLNSSMYCANPSSAFSYMTIESFSKLVGDYWSDIVEQVVPATTIWGSVKIYSNTTFDQQKFKYKSYTSLFGANPYRGKVISSPINGTGGMCQKASVISVSLDISDSGTTIGIGDGKFERVCVAQMNNGSEFIGSVKIMYETIEEVKNTTSLAIFDLGQYSS